MFTLSPEEWKIISPHLDAALEMTDEACSAWLESVREENPVLAEQLHGLLYERRVLAQKGFLETSTIALPDPRGLAGQTFGAYTLVSQIGQGGMGSVWLAERNDGQFERRVAVKVLNIGLMGQGGEERFRREGSILGRLVHKHIAVLLDAGVASGGQTYLVLEHVDGEHVDRYCDGLKLSIRARIMLFLDVLGAVAHAHSNLVVHRDIKPPNVLVRNDGQVKLLDFGIAKLLHCENSEHEGAQTAEAGRALTPQYASPEQLKGAVVSTATDVYSLGVLLYLLITGQHPVGPGPHTPAGLIDAILARDADRPSEVVRQAHLGADAILTNAANRATTPEKLSRMLRGDLDTIVSKALKKDPLERYPTVMALAEDLRRYLNDKPISARPETLVYRTAKFVRRNRGAVALATLASVATFAGTAGTLVQSHTAREQRDFALRQLARAEQLNSLNELLLTDVPLEGKSITARDLLEREEQIVEREHYGNAANHAELLMSIGAQYSGEEENARARRVLEEAYRISRGLEEVSTRAKASCELAWAAVSDGELERAETLFQEGLRDLPDEPLFGADRSNCLLRGTEIAYRRGDAKEVIARAEAADRALKGSPVKTPVDELNVLTTLAGAYGTAAQFREANAAFEQASARMTDLGYDQTQKAVKLFNDWGLTLADAGQPLQAEKAYHHAIGISGGGPHEEGVLPALLHNYSAVLRDLGRLPEAAHYAESAYTKAAAAGDQILINQTLLQRSRIYRDQHDFVRAGEMIADLEPRMKRQLPSGHFAFAALASDKALLAEAKGDLPTALHLSNQAVSIDEAAIKLGGQGAAYLPGLLTKRSTVELSLDITDRAEADASRALELLRPRVESGIFSTQAGRAYLALANAQLAQGKTDQAKNSFRLAGKNLESTLGPDHADTRHAVQSELRLGQPQ
ncbi:MAG TPA: serine/threonine-protein kinase [Terriglobales bacterium]|jgi:serine/threonine-protein kinase